MPLTNFNVVMVGENFPVSSVKIDEFKFRGRSLKESLRLPVVLQAENSVVAMQVFPNRFDVSVKSPDNLEIQTAGLTEMVQTFLGYVGRRTITAVGHNAVWTIPGSAERRAEITGLFVKSDVVSSLLGGSDFTSDIFFGFDSHGSKARMAVNASPEADVTLDFNFNFDLVGTVDPLTVAGNLMDSLEVVQQMSAQVEALVERVQA